MTHHDDGANDHHSVNGVCARHERGVQDGRHIGDHLDAQQNTEDYDVDRLLILKKKFCHSLDVGRKDFRRWTY